MTRSFLRLMQHVGVVVAMVAAIHGPARTDSYAPEHLFALEFGDRDNQVGVWFARLPGEAGGGPPCGPTGVAVGADGSIYIADDVNDCVKRFGTDGNLMMRSEGAVDNIQFLAVDRKGNCYALAGAGMDMLVKFGVDGRQLWMLELFGAIPQADRRAHGSMFGKITIGTVTSLNEMTVLCVRLLGHDSALAFFDEDGRFLRTCAGYALTPAGKIVSVGAVAQERLAIEVHVSDFQGPEISSYAAHPLSVAGADQVFAGVSAFTRSLFDAANCMYIIAHGSAASRTVLSPQLVIATDYIIVRHGPSGQPLAYLRLPGSPFCTGTQRTVDDNGDIYSLSYGQATVDVIRYILKPSRQAVQTLREFPSLHRGAVQYVPLRLVSCSTGMKLEWDPRTKQATVLRRTNDWSPLATFAVDDEGVIQRYGHLWVSTATLREKLGVSLRTDPKQRVAYLKHILE